MLLVGRQRSRTCQGVTRRALLQVGASTVLGLSLADLLRVSRHAVAGWEAGQSYPKADHLKAFIALGVQQRIFASGREAEEIRVLWRAAHQKVLLDEP